LLVPGVEEGDTNLLGEEGDTKLPGEEEGWTKLLGAESVGEEEGWTELLGAKVGLGASLCVGPSHFEISAARVHHLVFEVCAWFPFFMVWILHDRSGRRLTSCSPPNLNLMDTVLSNHWCASDDEV
jgi:hypothetical protein